MGNVVTPSIVANNILSRSFEQKKPVTQMKLQKLLYFIYREFYKKTDKRLFNERFEAWKYGPVLPSIYHEFKQFGADPITAYSKDSKGDSFLLVESPQIKQVIDEVWTQYRSYSGIELSQITHRIGTPWYKAWQTYNDFLMDEDILADYEW
ncbi:Panacea domain-containing protein [Alicyclobacillus fodiniaquatilis]|uniref:Panacea domain-containing protein n=1 Tax=Alicyclobacillus fodiniaquatilis TaxID=1661150 RepID=A0ABW4JGU9_9BACL